MSFSRFFTLFFSALFLSISWGDFNIANLPSAGRCTAESFGRGPGDQTKNMPPESRQTKIDNLSATNSDNAVSIIFTGITNLFPGSGQEGNDVLQGVRAFPVLWRCNENSTDNTIWTTIGAANSMFRVSATPDEITITDETDKPGVYWYIVSALVSDQDATNAWDESNDLYDGPADKPAPDGTKTDQQAYDRALKMFNASNDNSLMIWSDPIAVRISTLPKQELAINYPTSTGSLTAVTATTLSLSGGATHSVNPTFIATIDTEYVANPQYTWSYQLLLGELVIQTFLTSSGANTNTFGLTGSFQEGTHQPGVYSLKLSVKVTDLLDSEKQPHLLTETYSWLVKPPTIVITSATGSHTVEIGESGTFPLSSDYGYSKYATDKAAAEFVVVTNLAAGVGTAAVNGNQLTVTLVDEAANAGKSYEIKLQAKDKCKVTGNCNSDLLTTSDEFTFTVYAKPHEFDFITAIRTLSDSFQKEPKPFDSWIKLYNTASNKMKYEIKVNNNHIGGYDIYLDKIEGINDLSAAGLKIVTANSTTAVLQEASENSASASTGTTFALTLRATSDSSTPSTTTVTLGFVILDDKAPKVISAVWELFNWGSHIEEGKKATIPSINYSRTLTVSFDEPICLTPKLLIRSSGVEQEVNGQLATDTTKVEYQFNFKDWSFPTAQTFYFRTDADGDDCQPGKVHDFFSKFPSEIVSNSTVEKEYSANVITPMRLEAWEDKLEVAPFAPFTLNFTKALPSMTDADLAEVFTAADMGDFFVVQTESGLKIQPVTHFNYNSSGITIKSSQFLDVYGYPLLPNLDEYGSSLPSNEFNEVQDLVLGANKLQVGSDTYPPKLISKSVVSSDSTTVATFTFVYDEQISSVSCNPADFCNSKTVFGNKIEIRTSDLAYNTEYRVQVVVADTSSPNPNQTTEIIKWVTMTPEEATYVAETSGQADTEKPYVLRISPDLLDHTFSQEVPRQGEFRFVFNEPIEPTNANAGISLKLKKGASVTPQSVSTFENGFVWTITEQLDSSTDYQLELFGIQDLSDNAMDTVVYKFRTMATAKKASPQFAGAAFAYVAFGKSTADLKPVDINANLVFYFDQTVDINSVNSIFTLTYSSNGSDVSVDGAFVADGRILTFKPASQLKPGGQYTFSFAKGLIGLETEGTEHKIEGQFKARPDTEIRDFNIIVKNFVDSSITASHVVTASWRNPATAVDFYRITTALSDDISFASSVDMLEATTTSYSVLAAKMTTSFFLTDAGEKNLKVKIEACNKNSVSDEVTCVSAATAETYGLYAPEADVSLLLKEELVSKSSTKVAGIALDVKENKTVPPVTVKVNPQVLPFTTPILVSEIPAKQKEDLLAKSGASSRLAEPVQLGPDGLVFEEPIDVAIAFDPQAVLASTATTKELFDRMLGLVYSPAQERWLASGITKVWVDKVNNNEALLWLKVPHFSMISASANLAFADNNDSLVEIKAGETKSVTVGWDKNINDTTNNIRYTLTNPDKAIEQTNFTTNADSVMVYVSAKKMGRATYKIEVCDDSIHEDCASNPSSWISTDLVFKVTSEDADNSVDELRAVTSFTVYLTADTTAKLSWKIPEEDKQAGQRTIQEVEISYWQASEPATPNTSYYNRAIEEAEISGLVAEKAYVWRLRAKRGVGETTSDKNYAAPEYRFTSGFVEKTVAEGNIKDPTVGVKFIPYSLGLAATLKSASILTSTTTITFDGQPLHIATVVDLNFSATTSASVKVTIAATDDDLVVYHYDVEKLKWKELATQDYLQASKYLWYEKNLAGTEFTIHSKGGEGSPFAIAPKIVSPVVHRSGGGGGCSVAHNANMELSWLNFLLMLTPLGYLLFKKLK